MKHQIPTQLWGNARETRKQHADSANRYARIQQKIADLTACDAEEAEDIIAMPKPKTGKMKVIKMQAKPVKNFESKPKGKGHKVKNFADLKQFF